MPSGYYKRPVRKGLRVIGPSIGYIKLSREQYSLVDSDRLESLEQWNWTATYSKTSNSFYADRSQTIGLHKVMTIRMHHVLCPPYFAHVTDHRNGNTLDNRICNLRIATKSQNRSNYHSIGRPLPSGIAKKPNGWLARVQFEGRRVAKFFKSREAAIEYRNAKIKEMHGEFSHL